MIWRRREKIKRFHKGIAPLAFLANPAFWGGAAKVGSAAGGIMGGIKGLFGGGGDSEERPTYNLPDFPEDKYYGEAQETLYPFGKDILAGKPSEYYAPIGEMGGQMFEDVLGLGRRDIERTGIETAARLGKRGGGVAPGIAREVGEYTKKARFDDYMRALQGRQFLLGAGADITAGVGARGLTSQAQRSAYEVSKGNLALGYAGLASREEQARGEAMGEGIGGGISGLANLYSMAQLGRVDSSSLRPQTQASMSGYGIGMPYSPGASQYGTPPPVSPSLYGY